MIKVVFVPSRLLGTIIAVKVAANSSSNTKNSFDWSLRTVRFRVYQIFHFSPNRLPDPCSVGLTTASNLTEVLQFLLLLLIGVHTGRTFVWPDFLSRGPKYLNTNNWILNFSWINMAFIKTGFNAYDIVTASILLFNSYFFFSTTINITRVVNL